MKLSATELRLLRLQRQRIKASISNSRGTICRAPAVFFYSFSSGCAEACVSAGWAGAASLAFLRLEQEG